MRGGMNLNTVAVPLPGDLLGFEKDPVLALLLFHQTGGQWRFQQTIPSKEQDPRMDSEFSDEEIAARMADPDDPVGSLLTEIQGEKVSVKDQCRLVRKYKLCMDSKAPLKTCGSCGWRNFVGDDDEKRGFVNIPLSDVRLSVLLLPGEAVTAYDGQPEQYRKARSVYRLPHAVPAPPDAAPGDLVYLHPEAVCQEGGGSVVVCSKCSGHLGKGQIPTLSIADGFDFGCARRVNLPPLSVVEWNLIAKVRIYCSVLQYMIPGNGDALLSRSLSGHVISFPHEGPEVFDEHVRDAITFPRIKGLKEHVLVTFVGDKGQIEKYRCGVINKNELRADPAVVWMWLSFLMSMNSEYHHIQVSSTVRACTCAGVWVGVGVRFMRMHAVCVCVWKWAPVSASVCFFFGFADYHLPCFSSSGIVMMLPSQTSFDSYQETWPFRQLTSATSVIGWCMPWRQTMLLLM
jgi:hypothetical protein